MRLLASPSGTSMIDSQVLLGSAADHEHAIPPNTLREASNPPTETNAES